MRHCCAAGQFVAIILLAVVPCNQGTLSRSDRKKGDSSSAAAATAPSVVGGPVDKTVYERGLVTSDVKSPKEVIEHHSSYSRQTSLRNFDGHVLGYVTPWNNHGYDVAKTFASKLSSVSPVWLQLVPQEEPEDGNESPYRIMGTHDVDKKWLQDLRQRSDGDVKILPRVLFDQWTGQDYISLFNDPNLVAKAAKLIDATVSKHGFDGIVLEVWSQLGGQAKAALSTVIKAIGSNLKANRHTFVLVIPPPVYAGDAPGMFDAEDMDNLADFVDFFSLMSYDYSSPQRPGPNAHMEWIQKCVGLLDPDSLQRGKILLGLNFYGYDFTTSGGGPIIGRDYVDLLQRSLKSAKGPPRFKWDDRSQEHFIELRLENREKHTVFFPSLNSIQSRLLAAKSLQLGGVAIWELGQGLEYFYDLL